MHMQGGQCSVCIEGHRVQEAGMKATSPPCRVVVPVVFATGVVVVAVVVAVVG